MPNFSKVFLIFKALTSVSPPIALLNLLFKSSSGISILTDLFGQVIFSWIFFPSWRMAGPGRSALSSPSISIFSILAGISFFCQAPRISSRASVINCRPAAPSSVEEENKFSKNKPKGRKILAKMLSRPTSRSREVLKTKTKEIINKAIRTRTPPQKPKI